MENQSQPLSFVLLCALRNDLETCFLHIFFRFRSLFFHHTFLFSSFSSLHLFSVCRFVYFFSLFYLMNLVFFLSHLILCLCWSLCRTRCHHSSSSPLCNLLLYISKSFFQFVYTHICLFFSVSEFKIKRCRGRRQARRWWDLRKAELDGGCDDGHMGRALKMDRSALEMLETGPFKNKAHINQSSPRLKETWRFKMMGHVSAF